MEAILKHGSRSLPARGAWVEIPWPPWRLCRRRVAPHTGSVSWNEVEVVGWGVGKVAPCTGDRQHPQGVPVPSDGNSFLSICCVTLLVISARKLAEDFIFIHSRNFLKENKNTQNFAKRKTENSYLHFALCKFITRFLPWAKTSVQESHKYGNFGYTYCNTRILWLLKTLWKMWITLCRGKLLEFLCKLNKRKFPNNSCWESQKTVAACQNFKRNNHCFFRRNLRSPAKKPVKMTKTPKFFCRISF